MVGNAVHYVTATYIGSTHCTNRKRQTKVPQHTWSITRICYACFSAQPTEAKWAVKSKGGWPYISINLNNFQRQLEAMTLKFDAQISDRLLNVNI